MRLSSLSGSSRNILWFLSTCVLLNFGADFAAVGGLVLVFAYTIYILSVFNPTRLAVTRAAVDDLVVVIFAGQDSSELLFPDLHGS